MKDGNMKNTLIKKPSIADLELFLQLFQGRETVFAKQWAGNLGYSPVRPERPINADDILSHIQGIETYGIYPIRKGNTVKLVCFDVDLPKNLAELEEDALVTDKSNLLPQVKNICTTAINVFRACSFNSKGILIEDTGGRGYHIWFFFESSIPAVSVRKFAYSILKKAKVQCEVFPKQNEVAEGQYGNLIKLPLGLHKKYMQYSSFIDITDKKISNIENPFAHLTEIVPIPVPIIFNIIQERVKEKELKHVGPRETIIPVEAKPKETAGEFEKSPRIGDLIEKCRAFSNIKKKAVSQRHLEHTERLALAYIMINTEDGEEVLHQILSNCSDYDRDRTQKEIDYLKSREMKPISCRRLIEQGICDKFCRSEIREQSMDLNRPEPSPIRFALWKDTEPESILEIDAISFENVYRKSNLYRAWEQVKDYTRVNEAFFDIHAFENFEEHLEENIETLRFELRNNTYLPAPYRWYLVPKERKGDDFGYRHMAFVHPRDYIVIQAIINSIGPIFEKSLSDSCLGYRLDTSGKTGNSIFYSWQSSWQNRKRRVTSFLYHPEYFYYIKADISRFYDNIDRVRLYGLILDKIGSLTEICQIIESFLENNYIEDSSGKEEICISPSKGIPQGPAFSAFFANIYLDELDHLIEKKSSDYVRYVDDMVILCESKKQMEDIKKLLEDYLSSVNLELNLDKTKAPYPVTNSEPLLDFLGEMKYGMAGLFVRESYAEQLMPHQFLITKLEDLCGIRELNIYALEEIAKHLAYYLRMHEKIEPKLDDLAVELSKKVLEEYSLKPHHLVIILEVLIRNQIDLSTVISKCRYSYLKIVLCIVLTTLKETPPWAESLLSNFIKDKSSYILRGTAYSILSKLNREKYPHTMLNVISQEENPYVIERALNCLITMQSDKAKMCFLELVKRHFKGSINEMINTAIKWGDPMLDNLVKNQMKKIDKVKTSELYIILEFIFIICPDDFEELLLTFFSKDEVVLIHQLLFSSMDEIEKMAAKRGYLTFAHRVTIYSRVKNLKSDWLRNTIQSAVEEWRIGTIELGISTALSDVNHWLIQGDPSKKYQRMKDLSSREHRRQGGYQSWLVREEETKQNFVLEAVEEDILKEHKVIWNGVKEEDIKEQLESNKLSTLSDCFHNIEGGKKYYWFKYVIPDGYDILYNVYKEQKIKFDEQEVLNIVSSLFNQVECIKQHIGVEPVVNPYTVILGEGNQVQLINLFFGIPRKLYVSADNNSITDASTTTNALFNGLLSYELISSKCPIEIYKRLLSGIERTPQLISDYLLDVTVSLHFAWILDRLCYPMSPQNRYSSLNTLKKDIECFQKFRSHFQDKKLIDLPPDKKYWSEVLNVLNLRVARFLKLPYKIHDSIHENVIHVFNLTVHCMNKALANARNSYSSDFNWESKNLTLKNGVSTHLHEAGYKCYLFATGIRRKILSISKITQWPIALSIPLMVFYIPLKLELVALARAIGLYEIYNKEEIKNAIVHLMQSRDLSKEGIIGGVSLENFLTTSHTIKMVDLMNLFINKRFQDVINTDGSDIALLTLLTCVLLKNHRELREKWYTYLGLSKKVNLTKALNHLKAITENSIEIDRLIAKFLNEPLKKTFEDENALIGLYNFCLQDIVKLRRIMRINRMRTFIVQDFHHLEREVVVKFGRKKEKASHDLIIPFPPCYKTIWRKESITVDSVMSGRNNKITSLSLTPTSLKSIIGIGWEYESTIKRIWNRIKRYSKRSIWKIIAIGLFVGGVLLLFFKHATSGTILLTLGSLLLSPLIQEWYSKKRQTQENKRILG
jgi:hypothetical protein